MIFRTHFLGSNEVPWKFRTNFLASAWKAPKISELNSDLFPNLAQIFRTQFLSSNRIIRGPDLPLHRKSPALEDPEITVSGIPPQGRKVAPAIDENRASTDVEDTSDDSGEDAPFGAMARSRRAQSLDSARKRLQNKNIMYLNSQTLSTEQEETVDAAAELLTKEQKEQVKRRQEKIAARNEEDNVPGTSQNKGKAHRPTGVGQPLIHQQKSFLFGVIW